jgi:gamma-glutamylcyclotransferase (GGCT)/AIG2-like uncharacterized protein YtfP
MAPPYHLRVQDFDPATVTATDRLFAARTSSLPADRASDEFSEWLRSASETYHIAAPALSIVPPVECFGYGCYQPPASILMPRHSVTTLFTMFRHHMQSSGVPMVCDDPSVDARAWSLSLYHTTRPELLARMVNQGGKILHLRPADLEPGAISPDGGALPGPHTDSQGHLLRARLPVFVYGTLRSEASGQRAFDGALDQITPGQLPGHQLFQTHLPYVAESGPADSAVTGELLTIKPGNYADMMDRLDSIEGFRPGSPERSHYSREARMVTLPGGGQQLAWVYHGGPGFSYSEDRLVPGGDWIAARRQATEAPTPAEDAARPTDPQLEYGIEL